LCTNELRGAPNVFVRIRVENCAQSRRELRDRCKQQSFTVADGREKKGTEIDANLNVIRKTRNSDDDTTGPRGINGRREWGRDGGEVRFPTSIDFREKRQIKYLLA